MSRMHSIALALWKKMPEITKAELGLDGTLAHWVERQANRYGNLQEDRQLSTRYEYNILQLRSGDFLLCWTLDCLQFIIRRFRGLL
jgi:hypothetical protein